MDLCWQPFSPPTPRWHSCTGCGLPFRLLSEASESGSCPGSASLLLQEDESLPRAVLGDTNLDTALAVESGDTTLRAMSPGTAVCGEQALEWAVRRARSAEWKVGGCDVPSGFGLESSSLGSERSFG